MTEQETTTGLFASVTAFLKRRPDLAVFLVGSLLFGGGLASVIGGQLGAPDESKVLAEAVASPEPKPGRVGPNPGDAVARYIASRKALLAERSSKLGKDPTYGIVVFNSYRKASEVESLIKAKGLEAVSIQTRVPVETFAPRDIPLKGKSVVEAARSDRVVVSRELDQLEQIAGSARDADFKSVYEKQVRLHKEALTHLTDDPATVFAVVARGSNAAMARAAAAAEVRYVDIPDDPTSTPVDYTFAGLIPEDLDSATFAVQ